MVEESSLNAKIEQTRIRFSILIVDIRIISICGVLALKIIVSYNLFSIITKCSKRSYSKY